MAEGGAGAPSTPTCRRGIGPPSAVGRSRCCDGGCGLGRLVRRLRRRALLCAAAARPAASASASARLRGCQYDPLSYARNFDRGGLEPGGAAPDHDGDAAQLYYSYTFSSRFVLAPSSAAVRTSQ